MLLQPRPARSLHAGARMALPLDALIRLALFAATAALALAAVAIG
jgi:hypothetical protein